MAASPPVDFDHPNPVRVYEHLLGGHDTFAADRQEAERFLVIYPGLRGMAAENRAFIARTLTWAAGQRVRQFADLGAGLPVHPAVHEIAREAEPASRVVYVDHDRIAVSHTRAVAWEEEWGKASRS